jgi:hypothetical protein
MPKNAKKMHQMKKNGKNDKKFKKMLKIPKNDNNSKKLFKIVYACKKNSSRSNPSEKTNTKNAIMRLKKLQNTPNAH